MAKRNKNVQESKAYQGNRIMKLFWMWKYTIQDNIGFLIVLAILIVYSVCLIFATYKITKNNIKKHEEDRYPERAKAKIELQSAEIKRLNKELSGQEETIEMLWERINMAKGVVVRLTNILEGIK